jgi:2-dehydropantoate 2-reductase
MERILIVGTGALANLFGARLSEAGFRVVMLGTWEEGLAALREHGIRLESSEGIRRYAVQVAASPEEMDEIRYALVLVKSWQTGRAARQLSEVLAQDGIALSLQNGLGNRETLAGEVGEMRAAQGVTTTGATLLGPAHVRPGGEGVISVGDHPWLPPLVGALKKSGFEVETVADVNALIWRKLLINVAINPLTAILKVPNGRLLESDSARTLMGHAVREVEEVAEAYGIDLGYDDPLGLVEEVARKTAKNRSSMLQDISRGAPTEIDAICGAIQRAGQEMGVSTPANRTLTLLVKSLVDLKGEL